MGSDSLCLWREKKCTRVKIVAFATRCPQLRAQRVCLAIGTRSTKAKLMSALDLAAYKLVEIACNTVIIHNRPLSPR